MIRHLIGITELNSASMCGMRKTLRRLGIGGDVVEGFEHSSFNLLPSLTAHTQPLYHISPFLSCCKSPNDGGAGKTGG
jgi:hypothetical protein